MLKYKFLFLALYAQDVLMPDSGTPQNEVSMLGNSIIIPPSLILNNLNIFPQDKVFEAINNPSKLNFMQMSISLWSCQEFICKSFLDQGLDVRGLAPIPAKALESYFLPNGTFWTGAIFSSADPIKETIPKIQPLFTKFFGIKPAITKTCSYPWIPSICDSGWALAANQLIKKN